MDTTTETAVLKTSQKRHIDIFDTEISIRPDLANATSPLKKMSDSISQKSELKRDSIISSQKVHFKEFQIDGINSYGISNDKYRRNSTMDSRDDSLKSNVQKPINLHKKRILNIYNMGTALLAGNGLFHSWMLVFPC